MVMKEMGVLIGLNSSIKTIPHVIGQKTFRNTFYTHRLCSAFTHINAQ